MIGFVSTNKEVIYKHERTVRIAVYFQDGSFSTGTGFFVNESGRILTCWHVMVGMDLKVFRQTDEVLKTTENTEAEKVDAFYKNKIAKIEVEKPDGNKVPATLETYDYFYDLAVLEIKSESEKYPYFELEPEVAPDYGDEVNFCGYPEATGYASLDSLFAVNGGMISAFPEVDIAGGKYKNIQLNSICIGGNSGAPLFKNGSIKVLGIINGYQWGGRDDLATVNSGNIMTVSMRVPLNISFATGFDLLKEKSEVFNNLLK
jgi:S1-C subfamily serine protease